MRQIGVGISGASGAIYARDFVNRILESDKDLEIHLTATRMAVKIIESELGISDIAHEENLRAFLGKDESKTQRVKYWDVSDFDSPLATGSSTGIEAMVVVPCSMKSLAAIANGYADNLLTRAADVCLKERQTLILVPRETPLNAIHLQNMLTLAHLGVTILPPSPGFYQTPKTINDLVAFITERIIGLLPSNHHPV